MTTSKKYVLSVLALALIAIASVVWWNAAHQLPAQFITLPNGERYQFAGVTYGKENVPPSIVARLVRQLPASWAARLKKYTTPYISQFDAGQKFDEPQLFVWFTSVGTNAPRASAVTRLMDLDELFSVNYHDFQMPTAALADESGNVAGVQNPPNLRASAGWSYVSFPIIPKRSRNLECIFYSYLNRIDDSPEGFRAFGKITFRNPAYEHLPLWNPETLPIVKKSDTLQVRLDRVIYENPYASPSNTPAHWPQTAVIYRILTNDGWVSVRSELSDATGNKLSDIRARPENDGTIAVASSRLRSAKNPSDDSFQSSDWFDGVFWPEEKAWRLKIEYKREWGYVTNGQVTFTNVALPAPMWQSNTNRYSNWNNGRCIVIGDLRWIGIGSGSILNVLGPNYDSERLSVGVPVLPPGLALNLVSVKTDAGELYRFQMEPVDYGRGFTIKNIPRNATKMDLTFDLQKTRTVEFTFKPPVMTNWTNQ